MGEIGELGKDLRSILSALDADARASYSEISRETRFSRDVVRYQISQLLQQNVIHKFHAAVNTARLGLSMYEVFLKLRGAGSSVSDQLIDYLVHQDLVTWVARCDGNYDIGFCVRIRKVPELSDFLDTLIAKYSRYIAKRTLQVTVRSEFLTRNYLLNKVRVEHKVPHYIASEDIVSLDETNRQILRILGQNCRISSAEIARELEQRLRISPEAVSQRIKRLEQEQVITGYRLILNLPAMGRIHYKVFIYADAVKPTALKSFLKDCKAHPNIVYFVKGMGEWDYELDLEVDTVSEGREIMMELTRAHPQTIRDYMVLFITELHKYDTSCAL